MAHNLAGGLNPAQVAALFAAAAGGAPAGNVGQQAPAAIPEQANQLAQMVSDRTDDIVLAF